MSEMESVGMTALMIAWHRANEAGRSDPLFEDPFAHLFVTDKINGIMRGWETANPVDFQIFPALIRTRTWWFDDVVRRSLDQGTVQVVVLGAGCCCRAKRLARPGVTFYEVDTPAVLSFKADRLMSGGHTYSAVAVKRDYTAPGLFEDLLASGLDPSLRTLVLWEGNTQYLPEPELRVQLRAIATAFRDVSIALDYYNRELIEGRSRTSGMRFATQSVKKFGAPWMGWIDDIRQVAEACGLRVVEEQAFAPLYARLLPTSDLGANADPEYWMALVTNAGVHST